MLQQYVFAPDIRTGEKLLGGKETKAKKGQMKVAFLEWAYWSMSAMAAALNQAVSLRLFHADAAWGGGVRRSGLAVRR